MDFDPRSQVAPPPGGQLRLPRHPVWATYVLIALNVLVFLATMLLENAIYRFGVLVPGQVIFNNQWWRILTSGFLHADLMHIAFNMYALYILGRECERIFGPVRFLLVYNFALVGGSLFVLLFEALGGGTVGASGAVLGLLGALLAYFWQYRERIVGARQRVSSLASVALINLLLGLLPGISLWGHLGGTLWGFLTGWLLLPRYVLMSEQYPPRLMSEAPSYRLAIRVVALLAVSFALLLIVFAVRG